MVVEVEELDGFVVDDGSVVVDDAVVGVVDEAAAVVAVVSEVDVMAVEAVVELGAAAVLAVVLEAAVVEVDEEVDDDDDASGSSSVDAPPTVTRSSAPDSGAATVGVAFPESATTVTAAISATGSWPEPEQPTMASAPTVTARATPHRLISLLVRITRRLPRLVDHDRTYCGAGPVDSAANPIFNQSESGRLNRSALGRCRSSVSAARCRLGRRSLKPVAPA